MMTRLTGISIIVCLPITLFAQGGGKEQRAQADALFAKGEYLEAFGPYQTLVSNSPEDFDLNYRYGVCALYGGADKEEAIKYLKRASQGPAPVALTWYFLGRAYHLNYRFKDALEAYEHYRGTADKKTLSEFPVDALSLQCRNGQQLLSNLKDIDVHNKLEVDAAEFFRFYDLSSIGGRIVVTPDELKTSLDKKSKVLGLVYLPDKGGPIYFASYGKNGENGRDIYRTELLPTGQFATPVKLAGYINTDQDEDYPFMAPDGRTFYFCSKGHNSMGGYDVFKSSYDKGLDVFGAPANMDFAVNTPDDDVLYLTDPEGKEACFASGRDSKQGMLHVYRVSTTQAPINITVLKGTFASQFDEKDRAAHITVQDALTQETVADVRTDMNGTYVLALPRNGRYRFLVQAGPSGRTHVGNVEVPRSDGPKAYRQEMQLVDQGGEKLLIKNYFDEPLQDDIIDLALDEIKRRAKLDVGTHTEVAEQPVQPPSTDVMTRAGFAGNVTQQDAVQMAIDDAKALRATVEQLKEQAGSAYAIARTNADLADAAAAKAEQEVADANAAGSDDRKNELMSDAARQRQVARDANLRARAAYQAGQDLDAERLATDLKQQKADRLSNSLTQVLAAKDDNAAVIKLSELKARMDEKNGPDGGISAAEKMRRQAGDREREANAQLQKANSGREEEGQLADRVARTKREEADAKGGRKQTLSKEREELEQQLGYLHQENEQAFNKARDAQRTTLAARGQAELAKRLADGTVKVPPQQLTEQQVSELSDRISGTELRMTTLALDERYDGGVQEQDQAAEARVFDWGAAPEAAVAQATAPTQVADRDHSTDAQNAAGRTITVDQAAQADLQPQQGGAVSQDAPAGRDQGTDAQSTAGRTVTIDPAAQATLQPRQGGSTTQEALAVRDTATETWTAQGRTVTVQHPGQNDTELRQGGVADASDRASAGQGSVRKAEELGPLADNAGGTTDPATATAKAGADQGTVLQNAIAPPDASATQPARSDTDLASARGIATDPPEHVNDGQEHPAVTNGREQQPRPAQEDMSPEELAFVQANELAELKQLRGAEKDRARRDSLDQRIAAVEREMRATAAHTDRSMAQVTDQVAKPDGTDVARAILFAPDIKDADLAQEVFADYATDRARIKQDVTDPQERATSLHGLELMLVDSIDAERQRQVASLDGGTEPKAVVLQRVDRLRQLHDAHVQQAEQDLADAQREYAATESQGMEDAAMAATGSPTDAPAGAEEKGSATPHNDAYVDIAADPEHIYSSLVEDRALSVRDAVIERDRDLMHLADLEDRIDSMEEELENMPIGKEYEKKRDEADRMIDDRLIMSTEIGQRMAFINREEYKAAQDSLGRVRAANDRLGLAPSEPVVQMATAFADEAHQQMDQAAQLRKRADRSDDIVARDSLLRSAYGLELNALRTMDRSITARNYLLSEKFVRGERPTYEDIEKRLFDLTPVAKDALAANTGSHKGSDVPSVVDVERYKRFMGADTAAVLGPQAGAVTDASTLKIDADRAIAEAHDLEQRSVTTGDRANAVQDSVGNAHRRDRDRLVQEAIRLRAISDSLHQASLAAEARGQELAQRSEGSAEAEKRRKRLLTYYYLDDQELAMVVNEEDRSHYFQARSLALEQREQAARAGEEVKTARDLAGAMAGDTASQASAAVLRHRADSLQQVQQKLMDAASLNEAQAATLLQGTDPQRATEIMEMEQRTRRVEPMLAEARANAPANATADQGATQAAAPVQHPPPPPPPATSDLAHTSGAAAITPPGVDTMAAQPITAAVPAPAEGALGTAQAQAGTSQPAPTSDATAASGAPATNAPAPIPAPGAAAPLTADVFSMNGAQRAGPIPMNAPMPQGVVFKVQVGAFKHAIPDQVFSDMTPVTGEQVGNDLVRYTAGMFTNVQAASKATEEVRARGYHDAFVVAYEDGHRVSLNEAIAHAQQAAAALPMRTPASGPVLVSPAAGGSQVDAGAADAGVLANYPASAEAVLAQFQPASDATAYYNDPKAAPARQVETVKGLFFTVQVGVYSRPTALDKLFNITPLNSERTETNKIRYTTGVFTDMERARHRKDEAVGLGVRDAFITAYLNGKRIPMRDARALIAKFGAAVFADPSLLTR